MAMRRWRKMPVLGLRQAASFILKIEASSVHECWRWNGASDKDGYGVFTVRQNRVAMTYKANRISFWFFGGDDPEDKLICHHCDNPWCVNPLHLFIGTYTDNARDRAKKGRSFSPLGERNNGSRLTEGSVFEIRRLFKSGIARKELAKRFSINESTVHNIVKRKSWYHLPEKEI